MSKPLSQVLEEEYQAIHNKLPEGYSTPVRGDKVPVASNDPAEVKAIQHFYACVHGSEEGQAALCLSGGGIRSATFALGVLQGLARHEVLPRFQYLSTVSGGGYIGSWLSTWIKRRGGDAKALQEVSEALAGEFPERRPTQPEPTEVERLREYSQYLSPRMGMMSADVWALVAIYVRNLLLNWFVLLPILAGVMLLPRFLPHSVVFLNATRHPLFWGLSFGLLGFVCLSWSIGFATWQSHPRAKAQIVNSPRCQPWSAPQGRYLWLGLLPTCLGVLFVACAWVIIYGWLCPPESKPSSRTWLGVAWVIGASAALAAIIGCLVVPSDGAAQGGNQPWIGETKAKRLLALLGAALVGGVVAMLFLRGPLQAPGQRPLIYSTFAPPLLMVAFLAGAIVYRGLTPRVSDDADRERSARRGAWILIATVAWTLAAILSLYGPTVLMYLSSKATTSLTAVGGISGLATILLGRSDKTPANKSEANELGLSGRVRQWALLLLAPIFFLISFAALSLANGWILSRLESADYFRDYHPHYGEVDWHQRLVLDGRAHNVAILLLIFGVIGCVANRFININKFSLHATYRDRLIRAYLGASNRNRETSPTYDAFSGFDPADNLRLWELARPRSDFNANVIPRNLFHVVNITLNLVGGQRLAWQQRKAESFTASPLHCGSSDLGYRDSREYGGSRHSPGKKTPLDPSKAISLGTALAVSGAAVSPNWGYHSSPPIALLLSLFNVRLGLWLGNPGPPGDGTYALPSPRFAAQPMLAEAFGQTDRNHPYVYLSDGGHFDNLGVYEMVRRRCRYVVVSDAGADPTAAFEDLGNAIRKIYIDMGVKITFDKQIAIYPRDKDGGDAKEKTDARHRNGKYAALATIHYSESDYTKADEQAHRPKPQNGKLLYIKPAFYGQEPADIYNYATANADFPHESTADQFFTESQFESYRALGFYVVEEIVRHSASPLKGDFGSLFIAAGAYIDHIRAAAHAPAAT